MEKLISDHMPVIAFEANSGESSERVRERLEKIGYTTFLALDFYPKIQPLVLRVFLLTLLGVRYALVPVNSLLDRKYSMVFAMTDEQKRELDKAKQPR